jgi:BirA family transcriptional regulator, biotin operon repressor / biotin---[acetyl-CoA-carboxylase] ligase
MTDPRSNEAPVWTVQRIPETGSTNADLLAAATAGAPHGTVLVTDHQTAGKGRLGRLWDAPAGSNLLVSVLFRRGFEPGRPHEVTQRVAVAAARTAERLAGVRPDLKWPNDLLVAGRKLAGILSQAGVTDGRVDHVVVGMGLNLGWAPEGAARLAGVARDDFLDGWLAQLAAGFEAPEGIGPEYRRRLVTLGQRVRVELPAGTIEGEAVDLTPEGALVVATTAGEVHTVSAGDVHHLRPAMP